MNRKAFDLTLSTLIRPTQGLTFALTTFFPVCMIDACGPAQSCININRYLIPAMSGHCTQTGCLDCNDVWEEEEGGESGWMECVAVGYIRFAMYGSPKHNRTIIVYTAYISGIIVEIMDMALRVPFPPLSATTT